MKTWEVEIETVQPDNESGFGGLLIVEALDKVEAEGIALQQAEDDHKDFIFKHTWRVVSIRQKND